MPTSEHRRRKQNNESREELPAAPGAVWVAPPQSSQSQRSGARWCSPACALCMLCWLALRFMLCALELRPRPAGPAAECRRRLRRLEVRPSAGCAASACCSDPSPALCSCSSSSSSLVVSSSPAGGARQQVLNTYASEGAGRDAWREAKPRAARE